MSCKKRAAQRESVSMESGGREKENNLHGIPHELSRRGGMREGPGLKLARLESTSSCGSFEQEPAGHQERQTAAKLESTMGNGAPVQ